MLLITGAAGFIGGNFVHHWFSGQNGRDEPIVVLDKLTYAGNPATLAYFLNAGKCELVQGDICDQQLVEQLLQKHRPRAVLHFAAESHVDRSIHGPGEFIQTNMVGTFALLEAVRSHWGALPADERDAFRFLHVSTDEVYGSLGDDRPGVQRNDRLRSEQPVLGQQGGQRPSGARLPPHLRPADAHHQLQQQLRALSLPGEADPAGDPQRAGRQAAAGLRRRPEHSRLALRSRPLRGDLPGARPRPGRRDVQRRRQERDPQHRRGDDDLPQARRTASARRAAATRS